MKCAVSKTSIELCGVGMVIAMVWGFSPVVYAQAYKCVSEQIIGYAYDKKTNQLEAQVYPKKEREISYFVLKPTSIGISDPSPWFFTNSQRSFFMPCKEDFNKEDSLYCNLGGTSFQFNRLSNVFLYFDGGGLVGVDTRLKPSQLNRQALARQLPASLDIGKCFSY